MGNKASNRTIESWTDDKITGVDAPKAPHINIEKQFKWSKSNTKLETVHRTESKISACDSRRIIDDEKNNAIMFATADQSGYIIVTKMTISENKKGKKHTQYSTLDTIQLRTAWVMAVAISPSCKYIASGGLDNTVTIFLKNNRNKYQQSQILQHHQGYIANIKFIDHGYDAENLVLSCSGDASVILWDIATGSKLLIYDEDTVTGDIMSVDHIYLDEKHIIAFCSVDKNVYLRDITKHISDITESQGKVKEEKLVFCAQDLGHFLTDVNDVSFSPNGDFLAATSDDGTYEIYEKNYRYDAFWDVNILEWRFLYKRSFETLDNNFGSGNVVIWTDMETLMVGGEDTQKLYSTFLRKQKENPEMVKAVVAGVEIMIASLPCMNWMGLCETVANEILQFLNEYDIFDYQYKFTRQQTRITCLTSCQWKDDPDGRVMFFGCWDKCARVVIQHRVN